MNEQTTDTIGQILWYAMFATPLITVPLVWRTFKVQKIFRVIIGIVFACFISFFLCHISLGLIFRNGFDATVTSNSLTISELQDSVVKVEMDLSAFGVESDNFPSIKAVIDFTHDTSSCDKSFYNPAFKGSTYYLTKTEMTAIKKLLKISDIEKLKPEYKVNMTDQPTSTTKIFTTKKTFVFTDYGLEGDSPLKELYKIVYRYSRSAVGVPTNRSMNK